jgi:hypothetical protein
MEWQKRDRRARAETIQGGAMTLKRLLFACVVLAGLVGAAYVSQEAAPPGDQMVGAAAKFLDSLKPEQKAQATYAFDDKERTNWHFVPLQTKDKKPARKGLPLQDMSAEQKALARDLVKAGTSAAGYDKATTIMSLESILHDLEKKGSMVRNPEWYFFTLFGTPSRAGQWGWRVEGHHLSLNFVVDRGKVTASTPAFFGANPAVVKSGPRKGLRTLPGAEDRARELFASLDKGQQAVALQPKQFPEIEQGKAKPNVGAPVGLPAARMTAKQMDVLLKLIESYANRMPPEVAARQLAEVKQVGLDKVHFAFARQQDKPGDPHTYRVQGPTFVIEFLDVQSDSAGNPANHVHSVWRNIKGDFGLAPR